MKKFILWALCCAVLAPTKAQINHTNKGEAQQSYEKAYKKAHSLTNVNPDSAMLWAEICLDLAKNNDQYYRGHYLRGFNAYKLCMYGQAMYDYTKARAFAPNSKAYFKVNNSLGDTYLKAGKYEEAIKLNQQSIAYNRRNKKWVSLSYAYNVKASILRQQKDKAALQLLRKVITLRKEHAPKDIGYAYLNMAKTFAAFNKYDSAIVYQRLTLKHHPIQSVSNITFQHTQLAKYLLLNNQAAEALEHLQKVAYLQKPPVLQLFWMHTMSLYYAKTNAQAKALKAFARCDDLLDDILDKAKDIVTWRTVNKHADEMYNNALALPYLPNTERKLYDNRLKFIKTSLEHLETKAKYKDDDYKEKVKQKEAEKAQKLEQQISKSSDKPRAVSRKSGQKTDSAQLKYELPTQYMHELPANRPLHTPTGYYWFMAFTLLAALGGIGMGGWWFWQKIRLPKPVKLHVPNSPLRPISLVPVSESRSLYVPNSPLRPIPLVPVSELRSLRVPNSPLSPIPLVLVSELRVLRVPNAPLLPILLTQVTPRMLQEEIVNDLIELLEKKIGATLDADTREMIRLYYQGISMKRISNAMNGHRFKKHQKFITFNIVRGRFRIIAEEAGFDSFSTFMEKYREETQKQAQPRAQKTGEEKDDNSSENDES